MIHKILCRICDGLRRKNNVASSVYRPAACNFDDADGSKTNHRKIWKNKARGHSWLLQGNTWKHRVCVCWHRSSRSLLLYRINNIGYLSFFMVNLSEINTWFVNIHGVYHSLFNIHVEHICIGLEWWGVE